MANKKRAAAPAPDEKEAVLSIEVSKELYAQILVTVKSCGYGSVDEWLLDAIMDKI